MLETKCYSLNRKERKKLIHNQIRASLKTAKGSVKFCYGATKVLQALSVILCAVNIYWAVSEPLDLLLLFITFGIPFGLSFLPATVYLISLAPEYKFRLNEKLAIDPKRIRYGFCDDRAAGEEAMLLYAADLEDISEIILDSANNVFYVRGNIKQTLLLKNGKQISDTCSEIDIPNVFDVNLCRIVMRQTDRTSDTSTDDVTDIT